MNLNFATLLLTAKGAADNNTHSDATWHDIVIPIILFFLVVAIGYVIWLLWPYFKKAVGASDEIDGTGQATGTENKPDHTAAPRFTLNEQSNQPKPRGSGLSLDSVSTPANRPSPPKPAPTTSTPTPIVQEPQPSTPASVGPGDFEKALAQAGQRMDTLLAQTIELTRLLKLAEKAKTDMAVELNKATNELKAQIDTKDAHISKLENLLDRKSTFPSLRALTEVKKLCLDMIGTQKPLPHDDLIAFVAGAIDNELAKLDVQTIDFAVGTPLEKIPGEQVDHAPRHEATDEPSKHNQVARQLRPCYYLERDSKRIVVAKGLVVLYRYNAPSSTPEATPSTPAS